MCVPISENSYGSQIHETVNVKHGCMHSDSKLYHAHIPMHVGTVCWLYFLSIAIKIHLLICIQSNQICSKSPSATSTQCQNYYWKVPFNQYSLKPNHLSTSTRRLLAHWDPSKPQDRCLQKQCSNITVTHQTSGSLDELESVAQTSINTTVNRLEQYHRRELEQIYNFDVFNYRNWDKTDA